MSNTPLKELLHKTIKDLHTLHLYPATEDVSNYETLLEETVKSILQLLNYHNKLYYELNLAVSPGCPEIGSMSFLYYLNKSSLRSCDQERITNLNIFPFIQSYKNQSIDNRTSRSYVLKQLIKLLSITDSTPDDKKPKRIKESFSTILIRFSELLDFFIKLHSESEEKLVNYVNQCFNYELNLYSNLKDKLDSGLSLDDHDTEKIVSILDEFIGNKSSQEIEPKNDSGHTDNSIFSYESNEDPLHIGINEPPLYFQCNDENFSNLYQLFLQVSSFKNFHKDTKISSNDYSKYIRIMVNLYKKSTNIDTIEISDFKYKELKFNFFYNFFLGNKSSQSCVLPIHFEEINRRVITKMVMFPELYYENKFELYTEEDRGTDEQFPHQSISMAKVHLSQMNCERPEVKDSYILKDKYNKEKEPAIHTNLKSTHQNYSNGDKATLIDNLRYIIPLLNDFNFDFNMEYPSILKYYMNLIYHELPDIVVQEDIGYIEKIVTLVMAIIDYENEDVTLEEYYIRDTILRFYQLHNYLNKDILLSEDIPGTCLMRLAVCEYYANLRFKNGTFRKWNYKTLAISQLEYNLNYGWLPMYHNIQKKNILKKWFGKKLKFDKLESTTTNFYHQHLLSKVFRDIWLMRVKQYKELNTKAVSSSRSRWFTLWNRNSNRIQNLCNLAQNHNNLRLLRNHFKYFLINFRKYQDLSIMAFNNNEMLLRRDNLTLKKFIMESWYSKMNSRIEPSFATRNNIEEPCKIVKLQVTNDLTPPSTLSEKLNRLGSIEKYIIFSRYFKILKHAQNMQCIYNQVQMKNNIIFLRFFFVEQWLKKSKLQLRAKNRILEKQLLLKSNIFCYWKEYKDLHYIADNFHRRNTLKSCINKWKLESTLASSVFNKSNRCFLTDPPTTSKLKFYFTKWLQSYQLKCMLFESDRKLQLAVYKQITIKSKANKDKASRAVWYETSNMTHRFLIIWNLNYKRKQLMNEVSDLNIQRKYLNQIIGKHHHYTKDLFSIAENFGKDNNLRKHKQKLSDRLICLVAIRNWQSRYDSRFQTAADHMINSFNETVMNPNCISKYLILWVNNFNETQITISHLVTECNRFIQYSPLRKTFFKKWINATQRKLDLKLRAEEFETRLLDKKFLVIWYDQFLHVNRYLTELSDDLLSQKEFRRFRETLSIWSMKYIKNIERNHQSCELFTKRWQNVKLRSILELWIFKLRERLDETIISDRLHLMDKETSMLTNQSPLAKKSLSRNTTSKVNNNNDPNASYLYTPLKLQADKTPLTPFLPNGASGTSPTRLQETTLRLKNERIDALRKHFRKARATSTPTKERKSTYGNVNLQSDSRFLIDHKNSKFIRLSPPKASNYKPIFPPKPPNFAIAEIPEIDQFSSNHDNTSIQSKIPITADNSNERSIIETAKRMRRITPIFVPVDDDITEPRFSPVKKLKEKLKNNLIEISPTKESASRF